MFESIQDNVEQAQTRHARALKGFEGNGMVAGREAVTLLQLITTIRAMKLEIDHGMKMSRHVNVFNNVRAIFGWTDRSKKVILAKLQAWKFMNHPLPPFGVCDQCGATALVEVNPEDGIDQKDGTNILCHPIYEGCNMGFNGPASLLAEVKEWRDKK